MPDEPPLIDLKPSHPRYSNGAPKTYGRVHTGQMVFTLAVAIVLLAYGFWHRYEIEPSTLYLGGAFFGALGAGSLVVLIRRWI